MKIDNFKQVIYEKIYDQLEKTLWRDDMRNLKIDEIIEEQIEELLNNPEVIQKIVKATQKQAIKKHKELIKRYKESDKIEKQQKERLWKATKGILPCINNCGETRKFKKDQLSSSTKWACLKCREQAEKEGNAWDIYNKPMIINGKEYKD